MRDATAVEDAYLRRIASLIGMLTTVQGAARGPSQPGGLVAFQECYAATIDLGSSIYGANSIQIAELLREAQRLRAVNANPGTMDGKIAIILNGFLSNLQYQIEHGLLKSIEDQGFASAIGDLVALASRALAATHHDVAAVLASASLEDILKRKAETLGLDVEGKELAEVVNALKSKSFFPAAEAKVVASYVTLRNKALHAEWSKIAGPEVASLIAYLEQFIVQRF